MMTGIEIVDALRDYLAGSALMTDEKKPNGGLYKFQRPFNSKKEDVVINLLTQGRGTVAEGMVNVNIHVPNLSLNLGGVIDNTQPDTARLRYLTRLASDVLNDVWFTDYAFEVQQDNLFEDTNSSHYANLRIEFYSIEN